MKSTLIAWLASAGAVMLVAVDVALPEPWSERYRAELAVLAATLIAVIWYTRYTFESLEHARTRDERDLTRRRRSLATGVLAELKRVEGGLRQLHAWGPRGYLNWDRPATAAAIRQLDLFEPETAARLVEFESRISHTQVGLQLVLDGKKDRAAADSEIRGMATFAVTIIAELADRLVAEGGVMPEPRGDESILQAPDALPLSPFGEFDLKRGWL